MNRRPIYSGKVIEVNVETAELPNGDHCELEIVRHPGGAAVVAVAEDSKVCLLRQYRHAAGGWLWELPAGRLEPGEAALATAQRELTEEAGVTARDWHPLGSILSSPGVFTEEIHLFLARNLASAACSHEPHELIEVHWLPFTDALALARDGTIRDAKTLIGLFQADALMRP